MPMNWNEPPTHIEGEGVYDDRVYECEKCGAEVSAVFDVQVSRQTLWEPAEYISVCARCAEPDMDPSDREPDEDALEARRR